MRLNRITPQLAAGSYKTYAIAAPRSTHTRPATCAEVQCPDYLRGWASIIDISTELGKGQAAYIRRLSDRRFSVHEGLMYVAAEQCFKAADAIVTFIFEPGQQCFAEHRVALDREPAFLVKGGDWRGNPRGTPTVVHRGFDDWANDFGEHQDKLARAQS